MIIKWFKYLGFFLISITCASLSLWAGLSPDFELPLDSSPLNREDPRYLTSYAAILKPAKEAVVAVHSARVLRVIRQQGIDPREELLRRYLGLPVPNRPKAEIEEYRTPEGVGSGVVISEDGYIVTNNHVIVGGDGEAADEILVQLNDGRELPATIVGRDPLSDLAVLKVEAEHLSFLPVADSEQLEVGDIVFAIGNPMGVGLTITQGIVSATGRNHLSILGKSGYESFIQTDAPINPGNSGGALVDAEGRLVGINTAILSRSGGSIGIGFAIPSSFAHSVAQALVREGAVRRGILGVNIEDLNAEYIEAFHVPASGGVLVQSVIEALPAELAGIRQGDVIFEVAGSAVASVADLRLRVAAHPPGATVAVRFLREGAIMEFDVVLADPENPYGNGALAGELIEGIQVVVLDDRQRRRFALSEEFSGLVVEAVDKTSPYAEAFAQGAVILEINGQEPDSLDHARELLRSHPVSRFYIYFNGRAGYLSIRPY